MKLRVAQMISDTEAEGPGKRFALWVQGCSLRCEGCCNPEMFAADKGGQVHEVTALLKRIADVSDIEGISVLGGEPFEQAPGLAELCEGVRAAGRSVMVYSGYTLAELHAMTDPSVARALAAIDLLVDGRYERTQPEQHRRWIGSANQVLHFLSNRYDANDSRLTGANTVELRLEGGRLTVNGWPALADALKTRGPASR